MTEHCRDLLAETLDHTFCDDNQKRAVLVLGAGLHRHFISYAGGDASSDDARPFCAWNELLAAMAKQKRLCLADHDHPDATATWENLVCALTTRDRKERRPASQTEARMLDELTKKMRGDRHPVAAGSEPAFFEALHKFRDIVTLNIDLTIGENLGADHISANERRCLSPGATMKHSGNIWPRFKTAKTRVWHPHGHILEHEGVILGQRNYGMNIAPLEEARTRCKMEEKAWLDDHGIGDWATKPHRRYDKERRAMSADPNLMDLFLRAPMVFIGCSLDRSEMDLWWALHQRARNLANISPSKREPVFVLTGRKSEKNKHLHNGPAGVIPVYFDDYAEIWGSIGIRPRD